MFIETETGRLQNLFLLQDVIITKNDDDTFCIGYVQANGEIIKEGSYNSIESAETAKAAIYAKLLSL